MMHNQLYWSICQENDVVIKITRFNASFPTDLYILITLNDSCDVLCFVLQHLLQESNQGSVTNTNTKHDEVYPMTESVNNIWKCL